MQKAIEHILINMIEVYLNENKSNLFECPYTTLGTVAKMTESFYALCNNGKFEEVK